MSGRHRGPGWLVLLGDTDRVRAFRSRRTRSRPARTSQSEPFELGLRARVGPAGHVRRRSRRSGPAETTTSTGVSFGTCSPARRRLADDLPFGHLLVVLLATSPEDELHRFQLRSCVLHRRPFERRDLDRAWAAPRRRGRPRCRASTCRSAGGSCSRTCPAGTRSVGRFLDSPRMRPASSSFCCASRPGETDEAGHRDDLAAAVVGEHRDGEVGPPAASKRHDQDREQGSDPRFPRACPARPAGAGAPRSAGAGR